MPAELPLPSNHYDTETGPRGGGGDGNKTNGKMRQDRFCSNIGRICSFTLEHIHTLHHILSQSVQNSTSFSFCRLFTWVCLSFLFSFPPLSLFFIEWDVFKPLGVSGSHRLSSFSFLFSVYFFSLPLFAWANMPALNPEWNKIWFCGKFSTKTSILFSTNNQNPRHPEEPPRKHRFFLNFFFFLQIKGCADVYVELR